MAQQQGQQANSNGKNFESDIAHRLRTAGYVSAPKVIASPTSPYFVPQCGTLFHTIYHTKLVTDFYVWHPHKHPQGLIIEAKYQAVGGSVDEKFPYLVFSLKATQTPAMLLLIGSGARREAVAWCEAQQTEHFMVLTTWEAFIGLCNRGFF
jgi:hypothetical protein